MRKRPPPKYILHPGSIRSREDGQTHYIDARELSILYEVNLEDCSIADYRVVGCPPNAIHLYPNAEGVYHNPDPPMFRWRQTHLHSGQVTNFKIDCDALADHDLSVLAIAISRRICYRRVEGVPTGGLRLAEALREYSGYGRAPEETDLLIADDVMTTGASMNEQRAGRDALGVVIFSRVSNWPADLDWVRPIFHVSSLFAGL